MREFSLGLVLLETQVDGFEMNETTLCCRTMPGGFWLQVLEQIHIVMLQDWLFQVTRRSALLINASSGELVSTWGSAGLSSFDRFLIRFILGDGRITVASANDEFILVTLNICCRLQFNGFIV